MASIAEPVPATARYRIAGMACPQLLLRVLGLFAQTGDMTMHLEVTRCGDQL